MVLPFPKRMVKIDRIGCIKKYRPAPLVVDFMAQMLPIPAIRFYYDMLNRSEFWYKREYTRVS